jgi:hypothetical protein
LFKTLHAQMEDQRTFNKRVKETIPRLEMRHGGRNVYLAPAPGYPRSSPRVQKRRAGGSAH